jgi:threonine dehydrogenase-like Zn-dependent dehydrogenase
MDSLWLEKQRLEFRRDVLIPVPAMDEALIRVLLAGVCSTDLELLRGYYPFSGIPGHEFVGLVISSPSDSTWVGKRVVGEINIACGECDICKSGLHRHCEKRKTLGIHEWNGAFANYLVLPLTNLHVVPHQIPDEVAVFTEPLAAAQEIQEQVSFLPSEKVLIVGAGKLGQLIAQVLQESDIELEVLARHPRQRELLVNRNIRTITEQNLVSRKYEIVIEATGRPDGFALALKLIRPRGKIILKSTYQGNTEIDLSRVVVDEVTLIGSRCGSFDRALKLLVDGKVEPRPLIESIYPLEHGITALEQASKPGVLKVLLKPDNLKSLD